MRAYPRPQAVLFDLDGTLIDSAPDLGAAADKMRTDRGLSSLDDDLYRPMAGSGARGMLQVAFGMTDTHPDYEAYKNEFLDNYQQAMTVKTTVFDGVLPLLDSLAQQGLRWGVVTNKMARFTDPLTRALPLFNSALAVVSGDTTPHPKPHPAPLLEAAARLGVAAEECIYVGDDETDEDVFALDQRGHGDSEWNRELDYSVDAMVDDGEECLQLAEVHRWK